MCIPARRNFGLWAGLAVIALGATPPALFSATEAVARLTGLALEGSRTRAIALAGDTAADGRSNAPVVQVIQSAPWSPGDPAREAAGEFAVMLEIGRMLRGNSLAGIVGVGGTNGAFAPAAEAALGRAVCMGVPVVKLARTPASVRGELFIETHGIAPEDARRLLAECLARFGALPPAANPARPTARELAALQAKLAAYQGQFDLAASSRVAAN